MLPPNNNNNWYIVALYFTLSSMFISVSLLAIYRILRFPSRFQPCLQGERARKHTLSGINLLIISPLARFITLNFELHIQFGFLKPSNLL